ncbi:MAG: ECF transporter S component [Clostridia bacterium]|nr:ECF transporter S component [Clostridia bacterium]
MKKEKIYRLAITAILIAIIVVMAFTPVGYLKIGLLSITFLTVPIIIGSVTNGPAVGAILGLCFGITSLIQCFGMDAFGTALMQISAWKTVVMCLVPRVLIGVVCGLTYKALQKSSKRVVLNYAVSSITAPLTNTVLFMGFLTLFFWKSEYLQNVAASLGAGSVIKFLIAMVGINGVVELVVCSILGTLILIPLQKATKRFTIES